MRKGRLGRLFHRLAPGALAAGILFSGSVRARAAEDGGGCARVHKALENVFTTPAHVYTKETSSARGTTESETIYLDGKVYVLAKGGGRWTLSPVSAVEMVKTQRKSRQHAMLSCKLVGEQKLDDRPVLVYTSNRSTSDSRVESRLWIDKVSGLLLKQEEDMTAGSDNTVHRSMRFEYGNVAAPKLAD
ncbi:MAG TPA: hypothetical protein VGK26_06455 [Thermoanaerobaculia bacterium]|jgi:hypothetical protein